MRPVPRLNFVGGAPRPWIGLASCAAAALLLTASAWLAWQQHSRNAALAAALAQRDAQRQPVTPRKLSEADRLRVAQSERVASELRAPWGDLLATFEAQGRADIGLLRLEPDAQAGTVRVTGHARDTAALFAYVQALEGDPHLRNVALVNHEVEQDTPGKPLRFTLQAGWRRPPATTRDLS